MPCDGAPAALRAALRYELCQGRHRLFGVLLQLYARPPVLAARHGVAHTTGERQALALRNERVVFADAFR